MKRFQITIDGRSFEVQLLSDPHQERIKVEVDGQPLVVEVRDLDLDARVEGLEDRAAVPGATEVSAGATAAAQGPPPSSAPSGRAVAAPLPGVVKSIAVRPGQRVGPGDALLVIEAMKMDNVIRASRQGYVDAIHVAEGHRVAHGDVMIEYEE